METLAYNGVLYYLPATNADVSSLITQARQNNVKIRVRGSGHSFPPEIILEPTADPNSGNQPINILLSNMRQVTFNGPAPAPNQNCTLITAQAGCNLGFDPFDITQSSTLKNSLLYQMQQQGLSLPDLGGITHQTVGGFLCMGCSGGSTTYSFDDSIYSITVIPANVDNPQPVTYTMGTDNFNAAAVSMGLLGIIVEVQFLGSPTFNIQGSEMINTVGASTQVDLFSTLSGPPSLQDWLQTQEYTRIIWWPQPLYGATSETYTACLNNTRSVVWQASRIAPAPGFEPVPYKEVQPFFKGGREFLPEVLAGGVYAAIGKWPSWLLDLAGIIGNSAFTFIADALTKLITPDLFYKEFFPAVILENFVKTGKIPGNDNYNPQNFQDYWYTGLPMDNQMNDKLFPVWFTELWIDINETENVMNTLAQLYNDYFNNGKYNENNMNPLIPNGSFSVEIYAAKSSSFWLSPAYNTNVVRIDVMWTANNNSNPAIYYEMFWDQLKQYDFRAHWAKYQPNYSSPEWKGYLQSVYPKLNDFLAIRAANDPKNVFVNDYWAQQFGI